MLVNRELSWLGFNERVLQEAADNSNPLLERIKFLGIFSNNRDEFFRVRVATYRRLLKMEQKKNIVSGLRPEEVLERIDRMVSSQEVIFNETYDKLKLELAKNKVFIINETSLTPKQGEYINNFFSKEILSHTFPIIINNKNDLSGRLEEGTLYLIVEAYRSDKSTEKPIDLLVRVPVKEVGRFIQFPKENNNISIILLDDIIRFCIPTLLSNFNIKRYTTHIIKFTRDGELDIDPDASKSFLEQMSESIQKRKKASAVRFVYEHNISNRLLKKLLKQLKIKENNRVRIGFRYHNFKDFMNFPEVGSNALVYQPQPPVPHNSFQEGSDYFELLKKKDIMLHYPYQQIGYLINYLRKASFDPYVTEIYITFYRAATKSGMMEGLINAARNGKKVKVFLELQARFNEYDNILWIKRLQSEGVEIFEPIPGYKVHSKLMLIKRDEGKNSVYYSYISTGNFNETTAKVYADDGLFTANQSIGLEVMKVFEMFDTRFHIPTFEHLVVSPFQTRKTILSNLDREIDNVQNGKNGWCILKMNSLVDQKVAKRILKAASMGVNIKLIVRGICVLQPSQSYDGFENLEIISIIGRYLEHSRLYIFGNNDQPEFYIGSADMMPRNLDTRVEVLCPIYDKSIQEDLLKMMEFQIADNRKARYLDAERFNQHRTVNRETKEFDSQKAIYHYFKGKYEENCN